MDATLGAGLLLILAMVLGGVLLWRHRTTARPLPDDDPADSLRRVALGLIAGFVAVSVGLVYWQVIQASELTERPDNSRRIRLQRRIRRGQIFDRKGRPLVTNEIGPDGEIQRIYHHPMLSPVTGYWSLRYGTTGIEAAADEFLSGRFAASPLDPFRRKLFHETPVGADVTLTIDLDLQRVAVAALDGNPGAVVLMNVKTGEILALASVPYFDPNELVINPAADSEAEARRIERYWNALRDNPGRPLLNRATQGLYAPGSIYKTITLTAALERGLAKVDSQYHYELRRPDRDHPALWHANQWVDCQNHEQTNFDLAQGFAYSCNILFADLGAEMGHETYVDYARRFGLGSEIPFEIEVAPSQIAGSERFFRGPEAAYAIASTAMGQGELLTTPLQAVLLAVAPGNRGAIPRPHLIGKVTAPDGGVIRETQPSQWRVAMSPDTAARVMQCLVVSVQQGWARVIALPDMPVAGKTGTAEVVNKQAQNPHAWFIACAPADNPTYAVAVVREFAGGGATYAGPIVKEVLRAALGV